MSTRTQQQERVAGLVDTRYDVLVNGAKVGEVVKNKHNIWWGHFDPNYTVADADYAKDADRRFRVRPGRRKTEVVAAVVRAEEGAYAAEMDAERAERNAKGLA